MSFCLAGCLNADMYSVMYVCLFPCVFVPVMPNAVVTVIVCASPQRAPCAPKSNDTVKDMMCESLQHASANYSQAREN